MIERAQLSDREAFAAALAADGRAFHAASGDVRADDPVDGPAPTLCIRRERQNPAGAVTILVSIATEQAAWLALSVAATESDADGRLVEPLIQVAPVMKSSGGEYFVQTHVGRLVAAGEFTEYFWSLAGAHLGLDD